MKRYILALAVAFLWTAPAAHAQGVSVDTPMHFSKKLSGDQQLRFTAGGWAMPAKGTKLRYRVITNQKDWKQVWGYLYDDTVKIDFTKQRILAIYKSPASGGFTFRPKKVYLLDDVLSIDLDVVWDGKTTKTHPFLFLAVDKFKKLEVNENFIAPQGKEVRYP
jgi:hypothetical protein